MCPTCRAPVLSGDKHLEIGIFSGGQHPLIIKCSRCSNPFKLTAGMFNKMPETSMVK